MYYFVDVNVVVFLWKLFFSKIYIKSVFVLNNLVDSLKLKF